MEMSVFLGQLERGLLFNWSGVSRVLLTPPRETHTDRASIRATLYFWDDSHLSIRLNVDTSSCSPNVKSYSYHYMKHGRQIWRYDDADHHPQSSFGREHKHIGSEEREIIIPAYRPSHRQLREEISNNLLIESEDANNSEDENPP